MTVAHGGISLVDMYHYTIWWWFWACLSKPMFSTSKIVRAIFPILNHLGFQAVVARFESYDTQGWLTLGCLCPLVRCVVDVQVETIFGLSNSARCVHFQESLTQSLGHAHCLWKALKGYNPQSFPLLRWPCWAAGGTRASSSLTEANCIPAAWIRCKIWAVGIRFSDMTNYQNFYNLLQH